MGDVGINLKEKEIKISGVNENQDLESVTNKVLQRMAAEPANKIVLYKILEYCITAHSDSDVERTILSFPEMKTAVHSPELLLTWLENAGGIEHLTGDNGEIVWFTTPAGRNVVESDSFSNRLIRLFAQETIYQSIYLQIFQACLSPKSRKEIESMMEHNPILKESNVYPSYFIEKLEEAGGLQWDEKWQITSAGKDFLNER